MKIKYRGDFMAYVNFDNSRELDIILLGRVAIDFNPLDMYKTLAESNTFKKYLGGSPANIAVGLARLNKKVGFLGKVSDDKFGDFVSDYFKNEGIDISNIYRCNHSLGLTFTEILSETESSILMYRDGVADLQLSVEEVSEEYIKSAKVLLISGTSLAQSPSREAALKAMELAKKNGTIVIFDIDYRAYTWKNKDEIAIYYSIVGKNSDIVIGSREEFSLMEGLMAKSESDEDSANKWLSYGNKIVVIKHGKEGSTAYTVDGNAYRIKPFPVKLLKSFGGGDGYAAAFIYGLLEGWDIMDALEFGSAAAAMLVASHSCSQDMPKVDAIKEFIKKEKEEYGEMIARG